MLRSILVISAFIGFIISVIEGYGIIGVFIFIFIFGLCQQVDNRVEVKGGIKSIDNMDGIEFEHFTVELLKGLGYKAKVTQAAGDFGADVIAKKDGNKVAVQCKRYSGKVSVEAIYQVLGGAKYYNCNKTVVITNNYFTKAAHELSRKTDTILIDRDYLVKMIKESKNGKLLERYSIR